MAWYEREWFVNCDRSDCHVCIRMDRDRGDIERFVVQLQKIVGYPTQIEPVAQFDHDPVSANGHDVFDEGLHIDLYLKYARDQKIYPRHPPLRQFTTGAIVRKCTDYFNEHAVWFLDAHEGAITPNDPPSW